MHTDGFTLHHILHSADLVEDLLRKRLADLGIRPRQARILDALDRLGQASQAEIAREFHLTAASMSTMTVRLLEAGYIRRTPHPQEHRSKVLQLSKEGRALLSAVRTTWQEVDDMIAEKLGAEQAHRLGGLARDLRDALAGRPSR